MSNPYMGYSTAILLGNGQVYIVGVSGFGFYQAQLYTLDYSLAPAWASSNGSVATISRSGLASAIIPGMTTITATLGSICGNTSLRVNNPPVANAGTNQIVNEGVVVTLVGSGTDTDGTIAGYIWTQTAGPAVTLNGATAANPTFTAPQVNADTALTFALTVTDNNGARSNSASTNVAVKNVAPDLIVTAVSGSLTTVQRGRTFTFTSTTKNQGNAATTVATNTGLYLVNASTNVQYAFTATAPATTASAAIASGLAINGSTAVGVKVTVPTTVPAGTYYLRAVADYQLKQGELDENNNTFTGTTTLQVTL